tara:strand:- start:207 stop:452 length:246 start_codon:yes stop_codon:yes gene_type:complete
MAATKKTARKPRTSAAEKTVLAAIKAAKGKLLKRNLVPTVEGDTKPTEKQVLAALDKLASKGLIRMEPFQGSSIFIITLPE